jgi:hypothetical protein
MPSGGFFPYIQKGRLLGNLSEIEYFMYKNIWTEK